MTGIQASQINLRGTDGSGMIPMSQWTFGDFTANLVASGLSILGGYYLTLEKEDNILKLVATGAETGNSFVLASSAQVVDSNTTYELSQSGNTVSLIGSDGTSSEITITSNDGVEYSLRLDPKTNELIFVAGETESARIKITEKYLDKDEFLSALFSAN